MQELKKALRKELISRRRQMPPQLKKAADEDIFLQLLPFIERAENVFVYASTEIEVNTRDIIRHCLKKGIKTALPVSGEEDISFYYINSESELKKGKFGIDEPPCAFPAEQNKNTLCIIPALCADKKGNRLGYGRGYYDRFLKNFVGTSVIICYADFMLDVPTEAHDVKADFTIFNRISS